MRCTVSSRAGQVLAKGKLFVESGETGELQLGFRTDAGTVFAGGAIAPDGDINEASQALFRRFFEVWGLSDITITIKSKEQSQRV